MTAPLAATWFDGSPVTGALIDTNQTAYIQQALDGLADLTFGAWTNLTGFASDYASNATAFGFDPRYKVNGAGTVKLRGGIKKRSGSFASGSTVLIASLPSEIVPTKNVELAVAMDNAGGFVTGRIEIDDGGGLSLVVESSRGTWVSLDGIEYDIS